QGLHRSPDFGSSVEFAEYRRYTPGDPIRQIDWNVFARSDKYVIRKFQEETNLDAVILLDISGSMKFKGSGTLSKIELACYLTAGLSYVFITQNDSCRIIHFDTEIKYDSSPSSSLLTLRPALENLETIKAEGKSDIEHVANETANLLKRKSEIIIISDLLEPPEKVLNAVKRFHHDKHDITVFHVLDHDEIVLPFDDLAELRDIETKERLLVDPAEIKEQYEDEVRLYLENTRRVCQDTGSAYIFSSARSSPEELISLRSRA
ncbi:MAG: DUF58 domain-containing protein, partial [Planctomycetota bacterium]